jgi:hypothetical protein
MFHASIYQTNLFQSMDTPRYSTKYINIYSQHAVAPKHTKNIFQLIKLKQLAYDTCHKASIPYTSPIKKRNRTPGVSFRTHCVCFLCSSFLFLAPLKSRQISNAPRLGYVLNHHVAAILRAHKKRALPRRSTSRGERMLDLRAGKSHTRARNEKTSNFH